MKIRDYIRKKALGITGLIDTEIDPRKVAERLTFVNDLHELRSTKLKEYNVWYTGDGDELLNFYTRANAIDLNYDPLYFRNKKAYFWAVSSTESDIKRSHSGQPRNIVDTLSGIIGIPHIGVGAPGTTVLDEPNRVLQKILKDNNFDHMLIQKARPFTFVEGWGAWKINWDNEFRNTPILLYYRADSVDFIYKSNQLVAIIYRDYYQDEKKHNYILFEIRRIEKRRVKVINDGPESTDSKSTGEYRNVPCLIIEKELFEIHGTSEELTKVKLNSLPQLRDTAESIVIENFDRFLGVPNIYYEDSNGDFYGRSIFTGKIDLFDDLDQCISQSANTVRRSTVHEYFNVNYLPRDEVTGLPVMPNVFDRKYIQYQGALGGDGVTGNGSTPVQVTQPALNFAQYSAEEINILIQIISGIMSPATLGIDIAKKDNAEAQREKEKVTIFTRNVVMNEEGKFLKDLAEQLLIAEELQRTGEVTCRNYDVYVKYDEFADASFESKLEVVMAAWQAGVMSDELAVEYLHKDSSEEVRDRELKYIKEQKAKSEQQPFSPDELGAMGAEMGGMNEYDSARENKMDAAIDDVETMD